MKVAFRCRVVLPLVVAGLALASAVLSLMSTGSPDVLAVEPGVNCSTYTGPGGVCVIEVGDIWFCDPSYAKGAVCPTSIAAGDTVRWEYPSSGQLVHTITECDGECDELPPPSDPLWDSGIMDPGDSFEFTFTTPGQYSYYCTFHPATQQGLIRVLEPASTPTPAPTPTPTTTPTPTPTGLAGDVDCDGTANSIDAALILQRDAGLIGSLACQENADVNGDSAVNSIDAALILQLDAGLIDSLPTY